MKNVRNAQNINLPKLRRITKFLQKNMSDNYLSGQKVQIDYAVKGNQKYLSMICALTGFIKVFKTSNQSKNEAMRCVREWAVLYGMLYAIRADSGP